MELTAHIIHLLQQHDYVAIPGLGGFVAQYREADRHPVDHSITPPSKQLTFNRQLHRNDGLLQHRLVEVQSLSPEEARTTIDRFANLVKDRLERKEVVKLLGIGKLFMDVEGNTRFVQSADSQLLPSSFGLPTLKLQPVLRQKVVDLGPAVPAPTVEHQRRRKAWWPVAATVAVFLAFVTTFLTVPTVNQSTKTLFGWDTSVTYVQHAWEGMTIEPLADADITAGLPITIEVTLTNETITLDPVSLEQPLTIEANGDLPKGYFVIIGSFAKSRNADKLQAELVGKGLDAYRFPTTGSGFNRVGVLVSGNDLLSANRQMLQLRDTLQSDAWILLNQ